MNRSSGQLTKTSFRIQEFTINCRMMMMCAFVIKLMTCFPDVKGKAKDTASSMTFQGLLPTSFFIIDYTVTM